MMEQLISYQLVLNKSQADYLAASKYGVNRMQALVSLLELVKTADEELAAKYANQMRMMERMPDALSGAMGNQMYIAVFPTEAEMNQFYADAVRCW